MFKKGHHKHRSGNNTPDKPSSITHVTEFLHALRWYDCVIFAAVCVFCCMLFYPTADLWHTASSSMAYLLGHFSDFYDYNLIHMGGDDYYPFIYFIFAIWNLPLKIINIVTISYSNHGLITYERILPILFMLLTSIPVYLSIRKIGKSIRVAVYGIFIFLTSATMFISTICWGMYDTILVFFLTLGVYFFIRDQSHWDMIISMLLFGLSFATKTYSLIILPPLLVYRFKKLYQIGGYGILSLLPIIATKLLYMKSSAFGGQASDSSHFTDRLYSVVIDNSYFKISVFFLAYIALVLIAFSTEYDPINKIKVIYWTLPTSTIFFMLVLWHPQWLTLAVPFIAITTVVSSNRATYMLYDIVLGTGYGLHTIHSWGQFASGMVSGSFFGRFLTKKPTGDFLLSVFPSKYEPVYAAMIIGVLMANSIMKSPFHNNEQFENSDIISGREYFYGYLRFFLGIGVYVGGILWWLVKNLQH